MKRTIEFLFYSLLVAGLTTQIAQAAKNHHALTKRHAAQINRGQFLNSNAYVPPAANPPDMSYYRDEALSPPAGR